MRPQGPAAADSPTWPPAQVPFILWIETKRYCVVQLELVVNTADGSGLWGVLDHSMNILSALAALTDWTRSTGCGTRSRYYRRTQTMWRTVMRRHLPGAITTVARCVVASLPGKSALRDERA